MEKKEPRITSMDTAEQKDNTKQLKGRFAVAVLVFFIALLAAMAATYAWYVYNIGRHVWQPVRELIYRSVISMTTKRHTNHLQ